MKRPFAYITAPWSENEFENTENAAKYCRAVYDAGFSPVCPTLFLPLFLRDEIPQEHKDCIDMVMQDTSHQLFTESVTDEVLLSIDNEDETVVDKMEKHPD